VQSVPAPHLVARAPLAAAALLATAIAIAVAIPHDHTTPPSVKPAYNGLIGGVALQQARCEQWAAGTSDERGKVLGALAYSVGGATTSQGHGSTLTTGAATALFDRACSNPIAQHWLLYEIYIRAAGLQSYSSPQL
jgi:hypothetical protein